ncbi:hypothetical protein AVEN_75682-1 [Araneus ventricosus]|uniref:Uncharacterized protein n=1 Tax=Araneus ventricosus TaxID=182803 RepID=A0A4Y2D4S2_ARAVE|nr:hypothetical protein AVEN_75682-1 [Araneus ventricosus]
MKCVIVSAVSIYQNLVSNRYRCEGRCETFYAKCVTHPNSRCRNQRIRKCSHHHVSFGFLRVIDDSGDTPTLFLLRLLQATEKCEDDVSKLHLA